MSYRKPYYNEDHKLVRYGIKDFFCDAGAFFRRFFSPKSIFHAFRSVTGGFREYSVFFLALIIVQSFFWVLWMDYDLYADEAYNVSRNCDYNLLLEGYTDTEWGNLYNEYFYIHDNEEPEARGYVSYEVSKYYGKPGEVLIRLKFLLIDDSEDYCNAFMKRYKLGGENVTCTFGERTLYNQRVEEKQSDTVRNTLLCGVLGALIIVSLFVIRVNHFKFRYGIYMSFGAGFEKLIEICAWEMLATGILTVLPALGLSALTFYLVTGRLIITGVLKRILPSLLWLLCVIFAGVIPAVRIIASKTPLSMIAAEDNSNLVSSPERSFRIFGKSFPFHYELFSFIRFRNYYLILLSFCVVFTTLYSCGLFMSAMYRTEAEAADPQFEIVSTEAEIDEDMIDEIENMEGVRQLLWKNTLSCNTISSHLLLTDKQARNISGKTVEYKDWKADNNFRYFVMNDLLYGEVERGDIWQTEGDLSLVCGSTEYVAVTCSISNQKLLNFEVGDTLRLAALVDMDSTVKFETADKRLILNQLLQAGAFTYYDLKIAAVVDDGDAGEEYSVIMSPELYEKITGREEETLSAYIYLDEDCSIARCEQLRNEISAVVSSEYGMRVSETGEIYENHLDSFCASEELLVLEAFALLLISPLVWFFSQSMFMKKRHSEMYMLGALGGTDRELSKLFVFSGAVLSFAACTVTALFTSVLTYFVYYFMNVFMPSLGFGENLRYEYSFSWEGFGICCAVSFVSAVLATWLPFMSYIRERDTRMKVVEGKKINRGKRK